MSRYFNFTLYVARLLRIMAVSLAVLSSCARMGTPDGGLYDETAPKIVRTTPDNGEMGVTPKKIVLEFDEIIKLDNANSVVVSPPQMEMPEVEAMGRKVTVQLVDSLKPDMTYTIDFGNSISDNNEGNPFGDYAFTFSTGTQIDTFQVSGHVLDASNLEPVKDILVGLYRINDTTTVDGVEDSTFMKKPFERISHTDGSGHFVVKGLCKDATYRIFALKDQDQNYMFSQKNEMLAFTSRTFTPTCKPDLMPDTIWHDSIHYEDIIYKPYTHFFPDDITLLAFTEEGQDRHLLKRERLEPNKFSFYFTAPDDTLPRITGLNFDATDAFIVDASVHKDTINYWLRDSSVYNLDTLSMIVEYHDTDTTGLLVLKADTLDLVSKVSKAKREKAMQAKYEEWVKDYKKEHKDDIKARKKEMKEQGVKVEDDDDLIEIPPMPEEFMEVSFSSSNSMDPDRNIDITFPEPIDSVDMSLVHFSMKVDTVMCPAKFLLKKVPEKLLTYRFYAEWQPDSTYTLEVDTGAFVSVYGNRTEGIKRTIKVKSLEEYSTLFVKLSGADTSAIVQLLNGQDKPVKTLKVSDGKADFFFITPGIYYLRMFYDHNGNGIWDTGEYASRTQPEEMFYYPKQLTLKANWDVSESWNPNDVALSKQKPQKITKQKPDKKKTIKSRNAEKLAEMAKRKKKK